MESNDPFMLDNGRRLSSIVGIDPGLSGALGQITFGGGYKFVDVRDMPVIDVGKTTSVRRVDDRKLAEILSAWKPTVVILEKAWAMPRRAQKNAVPCPTCQVVKEDGGMGAASAFNYGDSYGTVRTVVRMLPFSVELIEIEPATWKRAAGLHGRAATVAQMKERSRRRAMEMWPDAPFERVKDHARAEALLIARFGISRQVKMF